MKTVCEKLFINSVYFYLSQGFGEWLFLRRGGSEIRLRTPAALSAAGSYLTTLMMETWHI
jgi:hypothetical protein